jgi:hypothetical protein
LISLDNYRMLPPLNYDTAIVDDMLAIIRQNLQPGMLADLDRKSRLVKEVLAAKLNGRANGHRKSVLQLKTVTEIFD